MMAEPLAAALHGVAKHYHGFTLGPLNLEIPAGSIVGLIGENGAGKTTLLKLLTGVNRPDAGTVELCREKLSLKDLTYRAASPLAIPMELQGQSFQVVGEAQAVCDPAWTAEALGNVLKNCMEHTPASGSITVTLWENPIYSQILVEDTGPGFSAEGLARGEQAFYTSDASRPQEGHMGMGLYFAAQTAKRHGGALRLANTGLGARAELILPIN